MYTPAHLTRSMTAMLNGVMMISYNGGCVIIPLIAAYVSSTAYAQEMCYTKASDGTYRKRYCEFNCCGITSSYCCSEPGTADTGLIVGLVVGILVVVAVVVGVVLFCVYRRRKARRQNEKVSTHSHEDDISTVSDEDSYPDKGYRSPPPPDPYYLPPVEMKPLPSPPHQFHSSTHRPPSTSSASRSTTVTGSSTHRPSSTSSATRSTTVTDI